MILDKTEEMVVLLGEVIEGQQEMLRVLQLITGCKCVEQLPDNYSLPLKKFVAPAEKIKADDKDPVVSVTPPVQDKTTNNSVRPKVSVHPDEISKSAIVATTPSLEPKGFERPIAALISKSYKLQHDIPCTLTL